MIVTGAWLLMLCASKTMAQYSDHRNRRIDSLETVLASQTPPQGKQLLRAYLDLMWGYLQTDGAKSSLYARKAVALSYEIDGLNARADALRILGLISYGDNDYDTALSYFNHALAVTDSMKLYRQYKESDIDDNYSALYGSIANVYNMQDKALLAIEYYQKALPIFEKYGWHESMGILYYNVGELHLSMGNNEEAERNYLLAVKQGLISGDSLLVAIPHKGLAKIYVSLNDYEKAKKAVKIIHDYYYIHQDEEPGDYLETLAHETDLCLMEGHEDIIQAQRLIDQALAGINDDLGSETRSTVYSAAASVAMKRGLWKQALEYATMAKDTDPDETYSDVENYEQLAVIYAQLGNQKEASHYVSKLRQSMERFATEHYQSSISQMEVQYQTLQKEQEIEQLTQEKRWLTWGTMLAGVILVLLLALLFFVIRWNALRRKHHEILARMEGEAEERVRIGRDLHDRMGALLTGIKLNLELFVKNNQDTQSKENALQLTDEAMTEMRNLAHHLMPDSLKRYGLKTAISNFCQTIPSVSFSFIGTEKRIEKRKEEALYYLVHELVNNAAKNAQARHIAVQLIMQPDYTAVNVSDDGKGLPTEEESLRFGMESIGHRVKAIGGQLDIDSKPGEGTEVNIEIKE